MNADIHIHILPTDTLRSVAYPVNDYGCDRPIAPADMDTATEPQPVAGNNTAHRSNPFRLTLGWHRHWRKILHITSTGPTTMLDNR